MKLKESGIVLLPATPRDPRRLTDAGTNIDIFAFQSRERSFKISFPFQKSIFRPPSHGSKVGIVREFGELRPFEDLGRISNRLDIVMNYASPMYQHQPDCLSHPVLVAWD